MGQPGGSRGPTLAVLLVVAGAGLSLLRQSGAGALNTVYAEDGSVFLASAFSQSTVDSLTTPYAGYLHTAPRILAELISVFPLQSAASLTAIAAALTTGVLALLVYTASGDHLSSPVARLLVASVVVLVPVGQEELPNSIANLHWPALFALFWLLLWQPSSRALRAVAITAVALIALSDILVLVFVPLAAWIWWRRRSPQPIALAAGLALQAMFVLFGSSERALNPEPVMWAPWWVIRAVPTGLLGQRFFGADVSARWLAFAAMAWLLLAAAVIYALRPVLRAAASPSSAAAGAGSARRTVLGIGFTPPRDWRFAAVLGAHCLAVYALPVMLSGQATPRYAAAPAMFLVAALAVLLLPGPADVEPLGWLGGADPDREPAATDQDRKATWTDVAQWARGLPVAGVALVALCAIVWAVNFRVPNERANGPMWNDELRQARSGCAVGNQAQVDLAPVGWTMSVPCAEVAAWE